MTAAVIFIDVSSLLMRVQADAQDNGEYQAGLTWVWMVTAFRCVYILRVSWQYSLPMPLSLKPPNGEPLARLK
jgi:hypothetical protein